MRADGPARGKRWPYGVNPRRLVVLLFLVLLVSGFAVSIPEASATDGLDLIVGGQDEMKTRNLLPAISNDVWTRDVLFRTYESVVIPHPTVERSLAWIAKGVDFDEDGTFEPSTEYNVWAERANATTPLQVTVYYDFNGVRWTDGVQMSPWDLFFSYHVNAQNPRFITDMRVLLRDGTASSYEWGSRQLNIKPYDSDSATPGIQHSWQGEAGMFGGVNDPLRMGVQFDATVPFVRFYESTLAPVMLPMHVWSRTGGGRHASDFGCAVWIPPAEASSRGIPACGNPDSTKHGMGVASSEAVAGSKPYMYPAAEGWLLTNEDVIGHGPFTFDSWVPGVEASVVRNEDFYTGVSGTTVYDGRLASILKKPTITGIRFRVYKTTQIGVFALQSGEIDFYHWNVGAEFVPDLLKIPQIAVESNAEAGYFYMGYNLREAPWGYEGNDPSKDVGLGFRHAVSHLIDRRAMVQNLLQNFGVAGWGFISPANTFWYNDNIPRPAFDLAAANAILDDLATPGGAYDDPRYTLDPSGPCHKDNDAGCRSLPVIGNADFEILTPQADYDPVRASAGAMIADAMRQVGINAVSRPTAFGQIVSLITAHDFDMFILGWRIGGSDPDYLFNFFACDGMFGNPHRYCNPEFDQIIEASRREMDRNARQALIFRAQEILAEDRPAEPLWYRTNIEGYRHDRFVNWTVASGTIWNFWSLQGIRPPSSSGPRLTIRAPSAITSESTEPVFFSVRDLEGNAVPGATVTVEVASGGAGEDPGVLVGGGQQGTRIDVQTDAAGAASASYVAPRVSEGVRQIVLSATATHPDFGTSEETWVLAVFAPLELTFLRIDVELPLGDVTSPGTALPIRITVRNRWGVVGDAMVDIEVTPAGAVSPPSGLSRELHIATAEFPSEGIHSLTIRVTKDEHRETWVVLEIGVIARLPPSPPGIPPEIVPDVVPIVSASLAGIAIAAAVAFAILRKSKR
jgi:ABC-type transport system substrate-binding protein